MMTKIAEPIKVTKPKLPGVRIFKGFGDFIKDLSQNLEKEHTFVHNEHKRSMAALAKDSLPKGK